MELSKQWALWVLWALWALWFCSNVSHLTVWTHWLQIHFNIWGTRPLGVRNRPRSLQNDAIYTFVTANRNANSNLYHRWRHFGDFRDSSWLLLKWIWSQCIHTVKMSHVKQNRCMGKKLAFQCCRFWNQDTLHKHIVHSVQTEVLSESYTIYNFPSCTLARLPKCVI